MVSRSPAELPAVSGRHGGQLDERIVAQRRDRFQGHITGPPNRPFVVLFQEDGADQAGDGRLVREDADDLGTALDLAVDAFERIGLWIFGRWSLGKLI